MKINKTDSRKKCFSGAYIPTTNRKMDIRALCRVCLNGGIKMHNITRSQLQEAYEKLTETKLETEDNRSTMLCYICYAQLRRCHRFSRAARSADAVLKQLSMSKQVFTQGVLQHPPVHNYSVTPTECVHLCRSDALSGEAERLNRTIKAEVFERGPEEEFKEELPADGIKCDPDSDGDACSVPGEPDTDSEDDVPLNTLKTDVCVKEERQKRKSNKGSSLDFHIVTLTKEQQIQDVLSRAASLNFLNSPFQCSLCYRGFVSTIAYRNHMERHDESSGPHECDICRLRYRTARLLRSHAAGAHARLYRCNKCQHLSHTKHQANDHERWHNGHTYGCKLCGRSFSKRTSYLTHARTRHASEHVCPACGDRFVSRHGLRMHRSKAHGKKHQQVEDASAVARFCEECNIEFHSVRAWQRHILGSTRHAAHAQNTKQCPLCRGLVAGSLADHLKEHERKLRPARPRAAPPGALARRLTCEQCGSSFVNKAKLSAHVRRIHLGLKYNKNVVCEFCGKKCTSNAALKYHQRTHTGERPHACTACGKRFADSNQLRLHSRTHTGEKPYSCEHCAKRFSQKAALNRHYRVHTGAKPYTCEVCSKSFSQSNSLKGHVRSVHLKLPACKPNLRPAEHKNDGQSDKGVQHM